MKFTSLIVLVLWLLLPGCNDTEGILKIQGKVLDEKTKATIPNRKITVLALLEIDEEKTPIYTGYFFTDSNGYFNYTLMKLKDAYQYDLCIVGDSAYAFSNKRLSLFELHRNRNYLTLYASKLTDFSIKINRKSVVPNRDTLYISWESNNIDGKILYPYKIENYWYESNNKIEFVGGKINAVIKTKVYADKRTIIHYKLFRNGKYFGVYDTIVSARDAKNTVNFTY